LGYRVRLDRRRRPCDRAMLDPAIDGELRYCDIVRMRIGAPIGAGRVRALREKAVDFFYVRDLFGMKTTREGNRPSRAECC